MTSESTEAAGQTVLTTFECAPAACDALVAAVRDAYDRVIARQPGFLGATLHVNDARTRVASYSTWERREDFQAMLRTDEMQLRNRAISELARTFEPVMYEVVARY